MVASATTGDRVVPAIVALMDLNLNTSLLLSTIATDNGEVLPTAGEEAFASIGLILGLNNDNLP